jgi:hypothetical protein
MPPHVRCPRGSHKNRAGQCVTTTPRRRIIRDVFSSPSPSSPRSPFINMNPEKNEGVLYDVKQPAVAPAPAPAAAPPLIPIRRKCPRGSRRDRRTGECRTTTRRNRIVEEPPSGFVEPRARLPRAANNPPPAPPVVNRGRCPSGTRRNRRTGVCEPTRRRGRVSPPAPAPAPPVRLAPAPAPPANANTRVPPNFFFLRQLPGPPAPIVRRRRCPPGTRRNSNGDCVPKRRRGQQPVVQEPVVVHHQETPYDINGVVEAYDAYMAAESPINDPDVLNDPNIIVFYITNSNGTVVNSVLGYRDRIKAEIDSGSSTIYKCMYADTAFSFYPEQAIMDTPYFYLSLVQNHLLHLEEITRICASDNKFWLLRLTNEPIITSAIHRRHIANRANPGYGLTGEALNVVSGFHCQVNETYLKLNEDPEDPRRRVIVDPIHGDQRLETWAAIAITPSAI